MFIKANKEFANLWKCNYVEACHSYPVRILFHSRIFYGQLCFEVIVLQNKNHKYLTLIFHFCHVCWLKFLFYVCRCSNETFDSLFPHMFSYIHQAKHTACLMHGNGAIESVPLPFSGFIIFFGFVLIKHWPHVICVHDLFLFRLFLIRNFNQVVASIYSIFLWNAFTFLTSPSIHFSILFCSILCLCRLFEWKTWMSFQKHWTIKRIVRRVEKYQLKAEWIKNWTQCNLLRAMSALKYKNNKFSSKVWHI